MEDLRARSDKVDYRQVFDLMPGMCLILDPSFKILAQNLEHAKATLSVARDVVGRGLFEVFPDNPNDPAADGVSDVRRSLLQVLKTRGPHIMPLIRYDVRPELGPFEERYWAITNIPLLGDDGYVRWILNRAEDATELVRLRGGIRG